MEPTAVLGVSPDATDEDIRAAYVLKVREHPPDRSPDQFERIRDAYEILSDSRRRLAYRLFTVDPDAPFAGLFTPQASPRRFAGPEAWLDVLRGK